MSETDSFIEEVTEEVRRDRLFALFRRYGWIAVVLILAVVGGAAYNEYTKAQARAEAEALGDGLLAALQANDAQARVANLSGVTATTPGGNAVVEFLLAAAQAEAGEVSAAVASLEGIATNGELPEIYREIAAFKALTLQSATLPAADRRAGFEALARPGKPLRMLAEEQLAMIDMAEGQTEAAIERFQTILKDAEVTPDLQQRAAQAIVALGGKPELRTPSQG
ncbi:hypothetical protein [Seohaeicola zhoushanensis]|uniref:Tetratricopeptide repeat-like domain-containing protein n=1 Tax=Seohaeicola zhoushanensis TaxID=1569283 RepID=A0A8J3GYD9_9RHOB|nr:hypothetical protein [Seohaeicola zhoushanensis]GHF51041.1 hypothetical protein GCM10017056_23430 [Seohaeicola zhoushanensis]